MASTGITRIEGVDPSVAIKAPCTVATTANITLSGAQTIDGVAVVETTVPTRVLVRAQTDSIENGIYNVSGTAWVRSEDFDGNRDVVKGTLVSISQGTIYTGTTFKVTTADPIVINTSAITFDAANAIDVITVVGTSGVDTYAKMRALSSGFFSPGDIIKCTGDGIFGDFKVKDATVTDNGGTLIVFTDDSNRYVERKFSGAVNVRWFGAVGDGAADDAAAIQSAINFDQGVRGREVYFPPGTYGITTNIDIGSTNTQFGLTIDGGGFNVSLITIITGFDGIGAGAVDTNTIFLIDGTGMSNHRKTFKNVSIADNSGIATTGFSGVKMRNGAFETGFNGIWFTTSKTHIDIDQDSLGPNVDSCVFDGATNSSIIDVSYKPGSYTKNIFTSAATGNADLYIVYDTASPRSVWPKSFGGEANGNLFLNPFRAIQFGGNKGLELGDSNKFQITSANATRFIQGDNSDSVRIGGSFYRLTGAAGSLVSNAIALNGVKNSKIDVILDNLDADGLSITDCDGTDINVTATTVTGNSVLYTSTQTAGGSLTGTFTDCGTVTTKNVIQCTNGSQTRILMDGLVFEGTVGDNDVEAFNTVHLIDNQYSAGVSEGSPFAGINRTLQIATDANDSIANAAGTDATLIDAIRDELHDLKDKMRTSDFLDG